MVLIMVNAVMLERAHSSFVCLYVLRACVSWFASWSTLLIRAKEVLARWTVFFCQDNTRTYLVSTTDTNNV